MELSELEAYYDAIDNLLKVLALALKKIDIAVIDDAQILWYWSVVNFLSDEGLLL